MHNKKIYFALCLLISWLVLTSGAIWLYSQQIYGPFVANGTWPLPFNPTLTQLGLKQHSGWQVVHVKDKACRCNLLTDKHIDAFKDIPQLQQSNISVQQLHEKGINLPATPAMLAFYNGELLYAGPYAQGAFCQLQNSLMIPVLKNELSLDGKWLNGETPTCRCVSSLSG